MRLTFVCLCLFVFALLSIPTELQAPVEDGWQEARCGSRLFGRFRDRERRHLFHRHGC